MYHISQHSSCYNFAAIKIRYNYIRQEKKNQNKTKNPQYKSSLKNKTNRILNKITVV